MIVTTIRTYGLHIGNNDPLHLNMGETFIEWFNYNDKRGLVMNAMEIFDNRTFSGLRVSRP